MSAVAAAVVLPASAAYRAARPPSTAAVPRFFSGFIGAPFWSLRLSAQLPRAPAFAKKLSRTAGVAYATAATEKSIYDFSVKDIDGKELPLSKFKGKVLLIVNVASRCGLTSSNYTELSHLYEKYKTQGTMTEPSLVPADSSSQSVQEMIAAAVAKAKAELQQQMTKLNQKLEEARQAALSKQVEVPDTIVVRHEIVQQLTPNIEELVLQRFGLRPYETRDATSPALNAEELVL